MPEPEDELYQERILDHYEEPYHRGHCASSHARARGRQSAVRRRGPHGAGDRRRDGTIREVYFDGDGCCISQAAASMLVEQFDGKPVDDVKQFTAQDMLDLFGAG